MRAESQQDPERPAGSEIPDDGLPLSAAGELQPASAVRRGHIKQPEGRTPGGDIPRQIRGGNFEEAWRINEARFDLVFDLAPHGMTLTAPNGHFVRVNELACQMLGYTKEELHNLRFQDVSHPDDLETSIAAARALLDGRLHVFQTEKRYLRKDGSVVWANLRTSLVCDRSGQPIYFVSHMEDITERKKADAALRESEERYRRLVEVSPDGILIHSNNKVVFVNPAAAKIFGATSVDQFKDIQVIDLVHPDSRPVVQERIRQLREGSNFQPFVRERLLRLDGTVIHVEVAGVPFVYGGQPAIQAIIRDVSETVRAEEERERLFREVAAARDGLQMLSRRLVQVQEEERRRIALELHDEVGQELTALLLTLQNSEADGAHSEASRKDAQSRVQELLDSVREISLNLRPTMLDDLGLLPALIWFLDRYTATSQIKLEFKHFGIEGRRFAPEIETAAYRIVQEALTNVMRHSKANGASVMVWRSEEEPALSIRVEDSGVGFDSESGTKSGASTGLTGMRERASLLGGTLWIESAPGKGTCLTAELPLEYKPTESLLP